MTREQFLKYLLQKVAREVLDNSSKVSSYSGDKGYLAEADLIAHKTFRQGIKDFFPDDYVLSEEDNLNLFDISTNKEFSWIIDPICGTTNYLYGFPFYSHSVTLFKNSKLFAAGVLDPLREELFFSYDNIFYLNDELLRLNNDIPLEEAVISINTNQSNFDNPQHSIKYIIDKLSPPTCRRTRIMESANLELAYVACGRIDAYYNPTDKPWDIAAAQLLVPSAGGAVKILNNSDENIFQQKGILAARSANLLNQILEVVE